MLRRAGRRVAWLLAPALVLLLLGGCAIVDHEQRRWIFMAGERSWPPGEAAAVGMHDVWVDYTSDHPDHRGEPVRLHGLWLPQPAADAPVLLFLHGVRWDVRASAPRMRALHRLGFAVLGIDYRGFGKSSGALPSETLVAEDVHAAWRWMARAHPAARRFVYGHSLGGAVAVRLAAEVADEAGLIVEGGFTSTLDVLRSTRWGWLPVERLLTQRFEAGERIADVASPVLVVHAAGDTMIAPHLGRALYDKARQPKRFVLIEGAVHEDTGTVGEAAYREALRALFDIEAPSDPTGPADTMPQPATAPASMPAQRPSPPSGEPSTAPAAAPSSAPPAARERRRDAAARSAAVIGSGSVEPCFNCQSRLSAPEAALRSAYIAALGDIGSLAGKVWSRASSSNCW